MLRSPIIAILSILTGFSQATSQTEVIEKVLKAQEGIETFEAEFVQTNFTKATGVSQRFEGKLWLKRPDEFRMEVVSPDTQLFVSDGQTMWMYLPELNQAIREDLKESEVVPQPSQVLFQFEEKYEIDFQGEDTVDDRTHYLLDLTPKEENPYFAGARVWLNPKSLLMKRLVVVDSQGNQAIFDFREVKTNTVPPESAFRFTPPHGVEVVEGMGGAQIR